MSSIQPVGGREVVSSPQLKKTDKKSVKESKDKAQISKVRDVFEKTVGAPAAIISSAASAVGGFLGGGVAGISKEDGTTAFGLGSIAAYATMGAVAGASVAGLIGGIAGGVVGVLTGYFASDSLEKIGKKVEKAAAEAVSDNKPSFNKVKDAARNFTEGALTGVGVGAVEGFKEGDVYGAGVVSGVIEGTKGVVTSALGKYEEADKPKEGKKKESLLGKIIKFPFKVLGVGAGLVGGVVGMGLESMDGLIQGVGIGVDSRVDADGSVRTHGIVIRSELALGGGVAGFMVGGPIGAGIGTVAGLVAGQVVRMLEGRTDKDNEIVDNLARGVHYAQSDNTYTNKPDEWGYRDKTTYEKFRDGVEGAMTGTATGAREGFKAGFAAGKGAVEGVVDGVGGIISGIIGAIKD